MSRIVCLDCNLSIGASGIARATTGAFKKPNPPESGRLFSHITPRKFQVVGDNAPLSSCRQVGCCGQISSKLASAEESDDVITRAVP
jgi:hypothetical protein